MKFFATAAKGTEHALREELDELKLDRLRVGPGGVSFSGRWEDAWRACLETRIALRILYPLDEFPCASERELYDGVRAVQWEEHVSVSTTLAVSAVGSAPGLDNTMFVAQRSKDAIVDRLRDQSGGRPSVDREDPDVAVFVRLARGRASVALDLAGEPLHRRGYRQPGSRAPLKESLAAALLRMARWDRSSPLCDPMCGSATLAIEADLWARSVAPGLARRRFGFERWASFDDSRRRRMSLLRERARAAERAEGPPIRALDADPEAVELARANVKRAGARVVVEPARLSELPGRAKAGLVIANPPYGERLEADPALWRELEGALAGLEGVRVALLLGPRVPYRPPSRAERSRVYNGSLECAFWVWDN